MTRLGVTALVLAGSVWIADGASAQCAMCRQALESSETTQALALHLNRGILFLLGAPFAVAATIGVAMTRGRRRSL